MTVKLLAILGCINAALAVALVLLLAWGVRRRAATA